MAVAAAKVPMAMSGRARKEERGKIGTALPLPPPLLRCGRLYQTRSHHLQQHQQHLVTRNRRLSRSYYVSIPTRPRRSWRSSSCWNTSTCRARRTSTRGWSTAGSSQPMNIGRKATKLGRNFRGSMGRPWGRSRASWKGQASLTDRRPTSGRYPECLMMTAAARIQTKTTTTNVLLALAPSSALALGKGGKEYLRSPTMSLWGCFVWTTIRRGETHTRFQ
mmetsp:Transcript_23514/g.37779  ORF Transcript_23514/g.37779 Transcript_23514/m.37779 type:complete len:220 (-) Transcript_23514:286-945(-)